MELLYRDEHLAVFNKPAGLLVHRTNIDRRETEFAMQRARDLLAQRVFVVHRLDKATSGALMFALNADVAAQLTEMFTQGAIEKQYLAVVRGYAAEGDVIDYPLREQHDAFISTRAGQERVAQAAVTAYQRLATAELPFPVGRYNTARYSLLRLSPRTGRRHQLRRHMEHIFHPIVGDTTHGDGRHNEFFRSHFNCRRLMLAATSLDFVHPRSGERMQITAPLAADFRDIAVRMNWTDALENAYG